jgi:hypothetical protein
MKQVILCQGCGTIIRKMGSYTALLTRNVNVGGYTVPNQVEQVKVNLCRDCTRKAGYKVKD